MRDQKQSAAPEEQNDEQARGPRGGNSGRSIPPGAELGDGRDAPDGVNLGSGYATDEWTLDPGLKPDDERH